MPPTRRTVRLAVLSDLHIDREAEKSSWKLAKRAFRAAVEEQVDHVVVAGDLFDCSDAMERDHERLQRFLEELGLWDSSKLTLVVGNHDIFHVAHRGSVAHCLKQFALVAATDAQANYERFCDWAGELVEEDERLDDEDLFPFVKRLGPVRLFAADTTAPLTQHGGNGFFPADQAERMMQALGPDSERRLLAIHNAPDEGRLQSLTDLGRGLLRLEIDLDLGYPKKELRRLEAFAEEARLDAILCGHFHALDDEEDDDDYGWTIGEEHVCEVQLVGRTGGVHGTTPGFKIVEVPARGKLRTRIVEF